MARRSWIKLFLEAKKITSKKEADTWLRQEAKSWAHRVGADEIDARDLFRRNFAMLLRYYDDKTKEKFKSLGLV